MVKHEQQKVKLKLAKEEGIKEKKEAKALKKEEIIKLRNFCKRKCGFKCRCKIYDQICIHLCGCRCLDKNDSSKNQFGTAQRLIIEKD